MTEVMKPGLPHRRQTQKNYEAKFLIIEFFFKKTNSNENNEDKT